MEQDNVPEHVIEERLQEERSRFESRVKRMEQDQQQKKPLLLRFVQMNVVYRMRLVFVRKNM